MILKKHVLVLLTLTLMTASGCSLLPSKTKSMETAKTEFCSHTQKIRAKLTNRETGTEAVFEGYIDASGNGKGLIEIGDVIREVNIANNKLLLTVFNTTYSVEDIGPYFSFNTLDNLESATDQIILESGKISSVAGTCNGVIYNVRYEESDKTFDKSVFTIDKSISTSDFLELLALANAEKSEASSAVGLLAEKTEEESEEETVEDDEPSFYLKSPLGITIDGKIYSIGDKMNKDDYYKDFLPEGISYDYVWDSNRKLETRTVSYLDTTGKVSFMTLDNIVFELSTTTDFNFLKLYKGQDIKEVKSLLGIGLNKKALESFTPMYSGLEVTHTSGKEISCKLDSMTIKLGIKNNALYSIFISQDRGYLHYDS